MSNFTFTWPAGPKDVIVTGTFDQWSQSLPLVKQKDGSFELTVPFPKDVSEKVLFKFVVDGDWKINSNYKTAPDGEGHDNNVIESDDFVTTEGVKSAIPEAAGLAVPAAAIASASKKTLDPKAATKEPELSTAVLPSSEGKQTTLGEPGVVVPEEPQTISVFSEVRDVDPKTLNEPEPELKTASTKEPELSTTVLPSSEGKQVTLGEPGIVVPEDPHSISAFTEVRDVDPKTLNEPEPELKTASTKEPELSTTVLPSSEGKQVTLGEPGIVVPEDPHSISAFTEVRDVDPKTLNEPESAPVTTSAKEPELSTTVLPSSEGKQTTLGEPGVVVPEDPHAVSAFTEVRDVDPKTLNEPETPAESKVTESSLSPETAATTVAATSAASQVAEEPKPKYVKKVLKKVKKSASPEPTTKEPVISTATDEPVAEQVKAAVDEPVTGSPAVASSGKQEASSTGKPKKEKKGIFTKIKKIFK